MAPEHLIFLVAVIIVVHRAFEATGLKLSRAAYAGTQALSVAALLVVFASRIEELPPRGDYTVRLFLMGFVGWHMVQANHARNRALRKAADERREAEERRARLQAAASADPADPAQNATAVPAGSVTCGERPLDER